ncbi:MAG: hypothetical protein CVU05_03760 [Bacteroidetes bacterium HGW-Bacteroidetes-21]|nr:MAG: hypothetical protein CVU05_03760 [Bacteroidetes bacterium HGW-Bacteroidetes-21]
MKLFLAALFVFSYVTLFSQDTLKVMTYNVLNYGITTSYCTTVNNNILTKEANLKTIFEYADADIININELGTGLSNSQRLLDSVLNKAYPNRYARGQYFNSTASSLVNMVYYNKNLLAIHSQYSIIDGIRDICFFKFYYKGNQLLTGDTAFLTVISAHLKAGSTTSDADDRAAETLALMNYIQNRPVTGNLIVLGDFNVYGSSEDCFQNLVNFSNSSLRFYDPINKLGEWNNNSSYAAYHTQSAWTNDNGCAATGGMDDRFDFILMNENIKYNVQKISYVSGSYLAIGQDGNRFNQSVSYPTNTSAPTAVINALQIASDHLPVVMKLKVNQNPMSVSFTSLPVLKFGYVGGNVWSLLNLDENETYQVVVRDLRGRTITVLHCDKGSSEINLSGLASGMYLLNYSSPATSGVFKVWVE